MKVYLVWEDTDDQSDILRGVFTTENKAKVFESSLNSDQSLIIYYYWIEEVEVDKEYE